MTGLREKFEDLYPTAKEIREIADDSILQGYFDEVMVDICHLETRLEFLSDEDAEREKGLKNRLAYARNTVKAIENHRKSLRDKADNRKVKGPSNTERVNAINSKKKLIKSISWHVLFVRAARDMLAKEVLSEILDATDAEYLKKIDEEVSQELNSPEEDEP